jgi:hypothetical protein
MGPTMGDGFLLRFQEYPDQSIPRLVAADGMIVLNMAITRTLTESRENGDSDRKKAGFFSVFPPRG